MRTHLMSKKVTERVNREFIAFGSNAFEDKSQTTKS
jgi:hypothetical protein